MLTKKQLNVIERFWKRGYFFSWDLPTIFASEQARIECIKVFTSLGLIKEENFKYFIDRERFLEYQNQNEDRKLDE